MKHIKKIIAASIAIAGAVSLGGCSTASDTVRHNLAKDAENFNLDRRIVFFNGITDKYLLTIEGRCAFETDGSNAAGSLQVVCETAEDEYKTHYLGLSDNVSFFVEQIGAAEVDKYHYKVMFRPETILPDIDMETSTDIEGDG